MQSHQFGRIFNLLSSNGWVKQRNLLRNRALYQMEGLLHIAD